MVRSSLLQLSDEFRGRSEARESRFTATGAKKGSFPEVISDKPLNCARLRSSKTVLAKPYGLVLPDVVR